MKLKVYRHGRGSKKVCFTAGIHGIENSAIQTACLLNNYLADISLNGEIAVIPAVNQRGIQIESRKNPLDGLDINRCFKKDWIREDLLSTGFVPTSSWMIAREVWGIARDYEWIIDLHSAGYGRYLLHAIFCDPAVIEDIRHFSFPFIIRREKAGTLTSLAMLNGNKSCALEIGGGQSVRLSDVQDALKGIINFLKHLGVLPRGKARHNEELFQDKSSTDREPLQDKPVPAGKLMDKIFFQDCRKIVKVAKKGLLFPEKRLGEDLRQGETAAWLLDTTSLEMTELKAETRGWLIYLRSRNNIHPGETALMILPEGGGAE